MRAQHNRGLFGSRQRNHLDVPGIRRDCVRDIADNLARESFLAVRIDYGEGDGVGRVCDYCEVPLGSLVSNCISMQRQRMQNAHSPIHQGRHAECSCLHSHLA